MTAHLCPRDGAPCEASPEHIPGWSGLPRPSQMDIRTVLQGSDPHMWVRAMLTGNVLMLSFNGWLSYTLAGAGPISYETPPHAELDDYDLRFVQALLELGAASVDVNRVDCLWLKTGRGYDARLLPGAIDVLSTRLGWAGHAIHVRVFNDRSVSILQSSQLFGEQSPMVFGHTPLTAYEPGDAFRSELQRTGLQPAYSTGEHPVWGWNR